MLDFALMCLTRNILEYEDWKALIKKIFSEQKDIYYYLLNKDWHK